MADAEHPRWHWDEVNALRMELAEQVEIAGAVAAVLQAELARLERENVALRQTVRRLRFALALARK